MEALRRHIYLEEEFLFPPLREAGLVAPIFVMLREHGELWDTLEAIEAQLRAGGGDGPLAASSETLLGQLERHNFKEESIVYPQADAVLTAGANKLDQEQQRAARRFVDALIAVGAGRGATPPRVGSDGH